MSEKFAFRHSWLVGIFILIAVGGVNVVVAQTGGAGGADSVASGPSGAAARREYILRPLHSARGHLHNKFIHVPIGFALAAFFLSLLALWRREVEPAIRWLVLCAAIGAVLAVVTGTGQAEAYDGTMKEWVVDVHRILGYTTAAALWVWGALVWSGRFRRLAFVMGLLAIALLTCTGFFGGVIAHG